MRQTFHLILIFFVGHDNRQKYFLSVNVLGRWSLTDIRPLFQGLHTLQNYIFIVHRFYSLSFLIEDVLVYLKSSLHSGGLSNFICGI